MAFVAGVSPDIPWHVTAFHKDYKMRDPADTTPEMLMRAAAIGRRAGLRYVYAGNLPGQVGDLEDTRCASCGELLVERFGYSIRGYRVTPEGACPSCATRVPGLWGSRIRGPNHLAPIHSGHAAAPDGVGPTFRSGVTGSPRFRKYLPRDSESRSDRTPPSRAS